MRQHQFVGRLERLDDLLVVLEGVPDAFGGVGDVVEIDLELFLEVALLRDLERTKQRYLQEELNNLFRRHLRRRRTHLGHPRELQGGHRGARVDQRIGAVASPERLVPGILTAASVVLLPLTLIASIFGMNVPVPQGVQAYAFIGILIMMGLLLVALVAYFRRRGWL